MAKKGNRAKGEKREKSILNRVAPTKSSYSKPRSTETPESLLARATALLQTSQPDEALNYARHVLELSQSSSPNTSATLPALTLIAEIYIDLGDIEAARDFFLQAVEVDPEGLVPEGAGGGAEKFLWLAQLCEEGGAKSVEWFERGIAILRAQIGELEGKSNLGKVALLEEKRTKLADALCGIVEVYMTDLSWEADAESRCESLITEAVLVGKNNPQPLQTLASIRISQLRLEDAKTALTRSIDLWRDLPPEDPAVPAFPTRISLARLLLETEMDEEASEVLERLVTEDDQSVEAWYLGGLNLYLKGDRERKAAAGRSRANDDSEWKMAWGISRGWLENCLRLYKMLDYEDERLRAHAMELMAEIQEAIGDLAVEDEGEPGLDEEDWEDDSEDEDMGGT